MGTHLAGVDHRRLSARVFRHGRARYSPTATSQRDALLRLFVLDKALYELKYE